MQVFNVVYNIIEQGLLRGLELSDSFSIYQSFFWSKNTYSLLKTGNVVLANYQTPWENLTSALKTRKTFFDSLEPSK